MWAYIIIAFVAGAWFGMAVMACFAYRNYQRGKRDCERKTGHYLRLVLSRLPQKVWSKCFTQDERNEIMDVAYPDNKEEAE